MTTVYTKTVWGREKTAEETTAIDNYIQQQVAAGTTDGRYYMLSEQASAGESTIVVNSSIRSWNTLDAANAFLAWNASTFTPAPTVTIYGQS